jgi:hypothetical protein
VFDPVTDKHNRVKSFAKPKYILLVVDTNS